MNTAFRIPADWMEDDDPTIEMELTPAQLEMLTRAAEGDPAVAAVPSPPPAVRYIPEQAPPLIPVRSESAGPDRPPAPTPAGTPPKGAAAPAWVWRLPSRLTIGLGIAALCALSAIVAYLTAPAPAATINPPAEVVPEPRRPIEPPPAPAAESPEVIPVFFANPFDATEVFEFPPGTSETEARDAVADALLKRARERLNLSSGAKEPPKPAAAPEAGAARSRLARRG